MSAYADPEVVWRLREAASRRADRAIAHSWRAWTSCWPATPTRFSEDFVAALARRAHAVRLIGRSGSRPPAGTLATGQNVTVQRNIRIMRTLIVFAAIVIEPVVAIDQLGRRGHRIAQSLDWSQWRGPNRDGHSAETGLLRSGRPTAQGALACDGAGTGFRRSRRRTADCSPWGARQRRVRHRVRRGERQAACGKCRTASASATTWATGRAARRPWTAIVSTPLAARGELVCARGRDRQEDLVGERRAASSAATRRTGATANRRSSSATASS